MTSIERTIATVAAVLLGAAAMVACGGTSAGAPPAATTTSAADEATLGVREHHRYHHHGGVTLFIALSLDTLGVSPEERAAVEKIRTDLHARMAPARAAEENFVAALADGVAAGAVDATKVDAALAQVTAAATAVHDASAEAINELHSLLTPAERAALVDKVLAHWAVWQKSNAEETASANPEAGDLARLAKELDLTTDQVDKIRAGLGESMKGVPRLDPQEIAAHLRAFGEAFRSEKFDAKALATANSANAHLAGWGATHLAHFVETVSPVLTAEQRAKLAPRLREHATHEQDARGNP